MLTYENYRESAKFMEEKLGDFKPEMLLILGSGLGFLGDMVENPISIPYGDIPHFKTSTAPGHVGRFIAGVLSGKRCLIMQGRLHAYEGHTAEQIAFPVRVAYLLGVKGMIVTNASGGVNMSYKVGELVVLKDFMKFPFVNPLIGENIPEFGPRFCDMSETFDKDYRELIQKAASNQNLKLNEGVYFYASGPQYETPAEIRAIRTMGGDLVGMSTAVECISANHCGMKILGISLVTNMAAGVLDKPLTCEEVLDEAAKAKGYFSRLIIDFLAIC